LYAYESQIPAVAKEKIQSLKQNYAVPDWALEFFVVHGVTDVYHAKECGRLIDRIPEGEWDIAIGSAQRASRAIWNFLTSVHK
jgi:pyrroloquinoline-quinone synthase